MRYVLIVAVGGVEMHTLLVIVMLHAFMYSYLAIYIATYYVAPYTINMYVCIIIHMWVYITLWVGSYSYVVSC